VCLDRKAIKDQVDHKAMLVPKELKVIQVLRAIKDQVDHKVIKVILVPKVLKVIQVLRAIPVLKVLKVLKVYRAIKGQAAHQDPAGLLAHTEEPI